MKINVFKTNVSSPYDMGHIGLILIEQKTIIDWNFDLEDRDKILRIVSTTGRLKPFISKIIKEGYTCEELED